MLLSTKVVSLQYIQRSWKALLDPMASQQARCLLETAMHAQTADMEEIQHRLLLSPYMLRGVLLILSVIEIVVL